MAARRGHQRRRGWRTLAFRKRPSAADRGTGGQPLVERETDLPDLCCGCLYTPSRRKMGADGALGAAVVHICFGCFDRLK
jgi:hypothetical protein